MRTPDAPDTPDKGSEVIWARPERASRGPVPSLSREQIAAVAVELADAEGIEAVSMRSLATRLDVGAASLYRYVDSKDELIDLMVDAVTGETPVLQASGDWRQDMRAFAVNLRTITLRHPWLAVEGSGRPRLGPNALQRAEHVLGALDGLGLEIDEMLLIIETIDAFVRGHTLRELSEQEAIRRSGLDHERWMHSQSRYITSLIDSGRYPLLSRVIFDAEAPHDPDRLERSFEIGLERVLDGLATLLG